MSLMNYINVTCTSIKGSCPHNTSNPWTRQHTPTHAHMHKAGLREDVASCLRHSQYPPSRFRPSVCVCVCLFDAEPHVPPIGCASKRHTRMHSTLSKNKQATCALMAACFLSPKTRLTRSLTLHSCLLNVSIHPPTCIRYAMWHLWEHHHDLWAEGGSYRKRFFRPVNPSGGVRTSERIYEMHVRECKSSKGMEQQKNYSYFFFHTTIGIYLRINLFCNLLRPLNIQMNQS